MIKISLETFLNLNPNFYANEINPTVSTLNFQRNVRSIPIAHTIKHATMKNVSIHAHTVELNVDAELNVWHKIIRPIAFARLELKVCFHNDNECDRIDKVTRIERFFSYFFICRKSIDIMCTRYLSIQ